MHYYITQYDWDTSREPSWGIRGAAKLDLRTSSQAARFGGTPQGMCFAVFQNPVLRPNTFPLGDSFSRTFNPSQTQTLAAWLGLGERIVANNLRDILWELFTQHADPAGAARWGPLTPTAAGVLELVIPWHSVVKSERFDPVRHPLVLPVVHDAWRRVRDSCYEARDILTVENVTWERALAQLAGIKTLKRTDPDVVRTPQWERLCRLAALPEPDHHRRCLTALCEKYRMTAEELMAAWGETSFESPLPHHTTINENWNCADSDSPTCQLTWTEITTDIDIATNRAANGNTGVNAEARADSDLATADHYAQAIFQWNGTGAEESDVFCRKDSTATRTFYQGGGEADSNQKRLSRRVSGTNTALGTSPDPFTFDNGINYTIQVRSDGSTISLRVAGVEEFSVTDTNITGNLRGGIRLRDGTAGGATADDYEGADITVAGTRRRAGYGAGWATRR